MADQGEMEVHKASPKRCSVCCLPTQTCICANLPHLDLATGVTLVMSHKEVNRKTSTGKLLLSCLRGSKLLLQGADVGLAAEHEYPVLLYPGACARPISEFCDWGQPLRLVVPDGTWSEARRIARKFVHLPQVCLPVTSEGAFPLRANAPEGTTSTMAAVAEALGILEGEQVSRELLQAYHLMVERVLILRGCGSGVD